MDQRKGLRLQSLFPHIILNVSLRIETDRLIDTFRLYRK